MKILKIKAKCFESQKSWLLLLGIPVLFVALVWKLEASKTKSKSLVFKRNSSLFLNSFKTSQANEVQTTSTDSTSIFRKVFAGIGAFFAVVAQGFATGVTKTFQFLGQVLALPVTATLAIFARKEAGTTDSTAASSQSRND